MYNANPRTSPSPTQRKMVTLEDQAQARKAKLAALKKRKQRHDAGEPAEDGVDGAAADAECVQLSLHRHSHTAS